MGEREMSDTPRTDEIWGSMHGSGYQMMLLAQKLEQELAEAKREIDRLNQWADSFTDIHLKERQTGDALVKETMHRAEKAEKELAEVKRVTFDPAVLEKMNALEAELAGYKADADRYRWLRDMNNDDAAMRCVQLCGAAMDEAIDEAIAGSAT